MGDSSSPSEAGGSASLSPDEAFALLGDETRVGILQALWDAFESGTGGGEGVPYSRLFDRVAIEDSGNFSYHLEKLTGPFVRKTDEGYELKQTGINVVRAVVAGSVTDDPTFGPTPVDVACPLCDAPVEATYGDEVVTAACSACDGFLAWGGDPGFIFLGLVPPAFVERRPVEDAFRAAMRYTLHQIAAMRDGVCPHCAGVVETTVEVCDDHVPPPETLCPNCDRRHLADAWMRCSTCKRSAFPPVRKIVLAHPAVAAFYHDRDVEHRFASWQSVVRSMSVGEELRSADPLRLRLTVPAGDDELRLTVDDDVAVVDAAVVEGAG